jgi:hypothetical protein
MQKFRDILSGAMVSLVVVLVPSSFAQAATYGFMLEGQDNYIFDLPSNPVPLGYGITISIYVLPPVFQQTPTSHFIPQERRNMTAA